MKKLQFITLWIFCGLLVSCSHPKNDNNLYFQGQYVIDENGTLVPFHEKIMCLITVTMYSQVSYGVSKYNPTYNFYSKEDGSFEYIINGTGSNSARLNSSVCIGDTLTYYCDTTLACPHNEQQKNIIIPLKYKHYFKPTITPYHFCFDDTLTFSINHDVLTYIELCYRDNDGNGNQGYITVWSSPVENSPSISFLFPEALKEKGHFFIRFTTLHYGTYTAIYMTPSQLGCN